MRGLKLGDPNPTFNKYLPHVHIIVVINKNYFASRDFISKTQWLKMWGSCMKDDSITGVMSTICVWRIQVRTVI